MTTRHLRTSETLEGGEDRISSLQDDLLCRILSLIPTKQTVATSVLSTRWKYLFASVTDLNFIDYTTGTPTTTTNFIAFVTSVISAVITKSKYIRRLYLNLEHGTYTGSLVASWMATVASPKLQVLEVFTWMLIDPVPLPPQLFHCRALTSLTLRGTFSMCVPEHVFFPSLKKIYMYKLRLPDDVSLKRFFSGCIVLERLILQTCAIDLISVFEVSIASLKDLTLDHISGDYHLLLNTPNLESFDFSGYATKGYSGDRLNFLRTASVEVEVKDENFAYEKVSQLLNVVANAESLSLGRDSMECLINQTKIFHKLTELTLCPDRSRGILALPNLLANAPSLEVLDFLHGLRGELSDVSVDVESYLREQVFVCVSTRLKEVIFHEFYGEEVEFKVVEYFLKNAEVLKKMSIALSPYWDSDSGGHVHPIIEDKFRITKRLLGLPRLSRACQIDLSYAHI